MIYDLWTVIQLKSDLDEHCLRMWFTQYWLLPI